MLVVNGRMDGMWRSEMKSRHLDVPIELFITLPAWARRATEDEAERLAAYADRTLRGH